MPDSASLVQLNFLSSRQLPQSRVCTTYDGSPQPSSSLQAATFCVHLCSCELFPLSLLCRSLSMPLQLIFQLEGSPQLVHWLSSWAHPMLPRPRKVGWMIQLDSRLCWPQIRTYLCAYIIKYGVMQYTCMHRELQK